MIKKILFSFSALVLLASCANKKDLIYYQDIENSSQSSINYIANEIQINDILYIKVDALIPDSAKPFNLDINASTSINLDTFKVQGYLVSQDGTIVFPILGSLKVAGKTTNELQKMLVALLNDTSKTLPTHNTKIMIGQDNYSDFEEVKESIVELIAITKKHSNLEVVAQMKRIVPEFKSMNSEYQTLDIN